MGNLGAITALVVNKECYLEVGGDQYIMIESMTPTRSLFDEVIHDTSGGLVPDMVGEAEESMVMTLKYTSTEYQSFHAKSTPAATGVMTLTSFVIEAINTSGSSDTITIPGYVKNIDGPIKVPGQDYVTIDLYDKGC